MRKGVDDSGGRAAVAAIAIATAVASGIRSFVGIGRTVAYSLLKGSMIQECSQECQRKRDILSLIHERYLEVSLCRASRNPGNIVVVVGGGGGNGGGVEGAVAARRREWREDFARHPIYYDQFGISNVSSVVARRARRERHGKSVDADGGGDSGR
ncbi:hypothetical protein HZH68_004258 [Vespula germanica]|uniref:Uncharacterized protein n=2 Tax=Vespula TaxID=7451 RepID=A0A834NHT8_VESGE|nr:hypothetical protein HZH68_004258 [Vespula germanica]